MLNLFAVAVVDVGIAGFLVGAVSLVKPLRVLGVHSRLMAIAVIGAAVVLILAGMFTPAPLQTVAAAESDLDRALPSWQFGEKHTITVNASPERVYRAIKETTAGDILFFRALVWIRRLGRSGPDSILNPPARRPLLDVATNTTFAMVADTPGEIVVGTVVVAPRGVRRARRPTPDELRVVQQRDGFAVAAMNFAVGDRGGGVSDLTTKTRVFATDLRSKLAFGAYWRMIYPGSSLIRYMWLRAIKRRAEVGPGASEKKLAGSSCS